MGTQPCKEIDELTESTAKGGASQKKTVIHHPHSHTSVDFLEEASSTVLPLQRKPMLSTCPSESSAFTSPTLMSSSEVIISH